MLLQSFNKMPFSQLNPDSFSEILIPLESAGNFGFLSIIFLRLLSPNNLRRLPKSPILEASSDFTVLI